jgi:hypothetical protein
MAKKQNSGKGSFLVILILVVIGLLLFFSNPGFLSLEGEKPGTRGSISQNLIVEIVNDIPEGKDSFVIQNVKVNGKDLRVDVLYSGGCEEHVFNMYSTAGFTKSIPPQTDVYFVHDDKDDPCDGILTETYNFDLEPIIDMYVSKYGLEEEIVLNVIDFSGINAYSVSYTL